MKNLLNRPDLAHAAKWFAAACYLSRSWDSEFSVARMKYGAHGPDVSGCGREHFPEEVKERLRTFARAISEASDMAYAARPRGVRMATMRKLARAIAARDGSGFYGPQP